MSLRQIEPVSLLFLGAYFLWLGQGCLRAWRARP